MGIADTISESSKFMLWQFQLSISFRLLSEPNRDRRPKWSEYPISISVTATRALSEKRISDQKMLNLKYLFGFSLMSFVRSLSSITT